MRPDHVGVEISEIDTQHIPAIGRPYPALLTYGLLNRLMGEQQITPYVKIDRVWYRVVKLEAMSERYFTALLYDGRRFSFEIRKTPLVFFLGKEYEN